MEQLTKKQEAVLTALKKYIARKGYPPTVRDLCEVTGLSSTATVQVHLDNLQSKGYINKDNRKNRTIEILVPNEYDKKNESIISVPLLGKASCGNPIEAIEQPNEYFDLPVTMINGKSEVFTLKTSGDSMINVGIYDGDIIVVEKRNDAKNGDTVVALTDDNEVTVKTFYKEADHFRLQPENDYMEPIILDSVTILGKVIGLYRKF